MVPAITIPNNSLVHPTAVLDGSIRIGEYTWIGEGALLKGDITIGDGCYIGERSVLSGRITVGNHSLIQIGCVIRGTNSIGSYVNIYDLVNIEGGRPKGYHDSDDRSVIGDCGWVNHGATMHGSQLGMGAAVGINAALDYSTVLGDGAILANGSATTVNTTIPPNAIAQGVPARVVKENITDEDRIALMGLVPSEWVRIEAEGLMDWVKSQLKAVGRA
jgi:carbonic anhydrase/acetyltransferase-like protein (isoleucine patch superfamily)